MKNNKHAPLEKLKYHVAGAIERGEKVAIEAIVTPKHTPGPYGVTFEITSKLTGRHQYWVNGGGAAPLEECEANAQLFAAAPEMLEALEVIKQSLELLKKHDDFFSMNYELGLVDRAIKKAKGEL